MPQPSSGDVNPDVAQALSPVIRRRPRLIADSMLGKLAKSLRMLGLDVVYEPFIEDSELLRRAREEGRVILTRDRQFIRRRNLPSFVFIESDHVNDQLAQVARELGLAVNKSRAFTRCLVCNGELVEAPKESVRLEVPAYVFETRDRFARCAACRRVYWRGTHVEGMERRLEQLGIG